MAFLKRGKSARRNGIILPRQMKQLTFPAKSVCCAIHAMKEVGLLVREGGDKGGKWIVKK